MMNINDGSGILIWSDLWIFCFRVVQPPHCSLHVRRVADLMDRHNLDWNNQLVHQFFPLSQANAILSILVAPVGTPDSLVWHFKQRGEYIVKSGSQYLVQQCSGQISAS